MKKFLITLICHNLLIMPAFCMISDSFAENNLDSSKPYPKPKVVNITDDFAEESLKGSKPVIIKPRVIVDEFAENNHAKNEPLIAPVDLREFVPTHTRQDYANYRKDIITDKSSLDKVEIKICNHLTTKNRKIDEGDYIEFETLKPITIKNKTYPKGTIITGRIETISQNKPKGIPADLVIGNFKIDNQELVGEIARTGANRSLWVYPASCAGACFFGLGAFLLLIRGGHAKISPVEHFTLHLNQ